MNALPLGWWFAALTAGLLLAAGWICARLRKSAGWRRVLAGALLAVTPGAASLSGPEPFFLISPDCGLYRWNGIGSYVRVVAWPGALPECSAGDN